MSNQFYRPQRNIYDSNPEAMFYSNQSQYTQEPEKRKPRKQKHDQPQYTEPLPTMESFNELQKDIDCLFTNPNHEIKNATNRVNESYAKDDYKDPVAKTDDLIYNNVKSVKPNVYLDEDQIIIDSVDRNISKYPNPFDYRVYFNSQYDDANIQRVFENVKSLTLETAVLPEKYYFIKTDVSLNSVDNDIVKSLLTTDRNTSFNLSSIDVSGSFVTIDVNDVLTNSRYQRKIKFAIETTYPNMVIDTYEYIFSFDADSGSLPTNIHDSNTTYPEYLQKYTVQDFTLFKNRFNLLNIDEHTYVNEYSTNQEIAKSFAIMFIDTKCNDAYYSKTKTQGLVFSDDNLGTVSRLSLHICDNRGTQLKTSAENYLDYEIPRTKPCTCYNDSNGVFIRDYRCSCTYFRHPYYVHFQNTLIFKIKSYQKAIDQEIF